MLGGPARVGKTTLAKWLSEYAYNNGYTPILLPFAQALKDEAKEKGYTKEKNAEEYRLFCQTLGSSMREQDEDYWVKKFRDKVKFIYEQEQKALKTDPTTWHEKVIIVDDCRYMNEIACARDLRALTVFISASGRELEDHDAEWRQHESEELANKIEAGDKDYNEVFHYVIKNEGTLEEYKTKCTNRFEEWFHITAESLLDTLCTCELCTSSRDDREPDPETIIKEIIDMIINQGDDNDNTKQHKKT
jgi:hypothetical protein